ncbi:methionyl-tRNA formyltransferase [Chlamydiifrater phoenicopteri]|uniref:methionyl-tRNA formyltransferase n=1 Tax=Chlamydiifrater phoenicopteri TaxID=2681469 RepID=UPI001BCCD15C|nr:methionyl-tRNA formyltransferase [Chlamydiifrater phoenicopteri]
MSNLKAVFFGTPVFARTVLAGLLEKGVSILSVVTRTDKPGKRSSQTIPSPVKELALERGIPVLQPEKASDPAFIEELRSVGADIFLVVAYGAILRQVVLDIPKFGCYNLHAGLLPAYRGAAPIQRCIMDGVTESGNTVIRMDAGMDTGDIALKTLVPVLPDMTAGELAEELSLGGADALVHVMHAIEDGTLILEKQDNALASIAPKLEKSEGRLCWDDSVDKVYNSFRGVTPSPGAWMTVSIRGGEPKRLSILEARPVQGSFQGQPGDLLRVSKKDLMVLCRDGALSLKKVKLEGKGALSTENFLNGIAENEVAASSQ